MVFKSRSSERGFYAVSVVLFAASTGVTIIGCASMSAMGGMPMPGGWTMSMMWMRMPGQTWLGAGAAFLGMWVVMMVAMMLPSLVPMLWRYRQAVGRTDETRLGWLTARVGSTASGACISGSTAHPRAATRRASGSAGTMNTASAE